MSAKKSRKRAKKDDITLEPRPKAVKPTGRPPQAVVMTRHDGDMIERQGRGFSMGEIEGASLSGRLAMAWGVGVDPLRRSVLQVNVESLTKWYSPVPKKPEAPAASANETKAKGTVKSRRTRKKKEA